MTPPPNEVDVAEAALDSQKRNDKKRGGGAYLGVEEHYATVVAANNDFSAVTGEGGTGDDSLGLCPTASHGGGRGGRGGQTRRQRYVHPESHLLIRDIP